MTLNLPVNSLGAAVQLEKELSELRAKAKEEGLDGEEEEQDLRLVGACLFD